MPIKNKALILIVAGTIAINPARSFAHDPSKHKGKPVVGEIAEVTANSFTLRTERETIKVNISGNPKIEQSDGLGGKQDLKPGSKANVFGTRLANGELIAKEIVISPEGERSAMPAQHSMPAMGAK